MTFFASVSINSQKKSQIETHADGLIQSMRKPSRLIAEQMMRGKRRQETQQSMPKRNDLNLE